MVDVYSDGELIAEALAEANLAEVKSRDEIEERLASLRQQQAAAQREPSTATSRPSRKDRCLHPTAKSVSAC
jgi:hypothetical protein